MNVSQSIDSLQFNDYLISNEKIKPSLTNPMLFIA